MFTNVEVITTLILVMVTVQTIQSLSLNMTTLNMTGENLTCIDFDTLNQMKQLQSIDYQNGNMSYFPDKNCSNPVHEEDSRILDLPELQKSCFTKDQVKKDAKLGLIPSVKFCHLP